jgi:hypothetical protein
MEQPVNKKIAADDESEDQAADLPEEAAPEGSQEADPAEQKAGGTGGKNDPDVISTATGLQGGVHN